VNIKPSAFGKFLKLGSPMLAALGLLHVTGTSTPAQTGPFAVVATAIASFNNLTSTTEFGHFTWRGGLILTSPSEDFGGLSGLSLGKNCEDLLAISDRGDWLAAKLSYQGETLAGLSGPHKERMRDSSGKPLRVGIWSDAEAIATLRSGKTAIAFERRKRIGIYDLVAKGLGAPFRALQYPAGIDDGPWNGEIESLGQLPSGDFVAIAERQYDGSGNSLGWIWRGNRQTAFAVERHGSYNVTDLAVLPDGKVLTLERRVNALSLPAMAIRRFDANAVKPGELVKPELLLEASFPLYVIDNMEGLALCERDGETRVTLVSDNNFNAAIQRTLLLQFAYRP
jgi:hypothetical protein